MAGKYRTTRAKKHSESDDDEEYDDELQTSSSSRSFQHHDSSFGTPSSNQDRSHNNSGSSFRGNESLSSPYSYSPKASDRSSSFPKSPSCYPDLSQEINQSGDSPTHKRLYPDLKTIPPESDYSTRRRNISSSASPKVSPLKSKKRTSENDSSNNMPTYLVVGGALVVFVIIALVAKSYLLNSPVPITAEPTGSISKEERFGIFEEELKAFKHEFPNQTNRFWATVSASARHVYFQRDPCFPSVILMASHAKHKRLNSCLAEKIAGMFCASQGVEISSSSGTSLNIDVDDIKHNSPQDQKKYLDKMLHLAFTKAGKKSIVISNVHALSPQAALLLHGFCDGDNAPYQDVMIVLTFTVEDDVLFTSVKQVEQFLTQVWQRGLHMDKLTALMSRIANNPVVVKEEQDSIVNQMCP